MKLWNSLGPTFVSAIRHPQLWLVQLLGNALILITFGLWLHIPDAHWWELFFQFVIALALIVGLLVLHGGTLNFFSDVDANKTSRLGTSLKNALRHLPAFVIFVAIFGYLMWLLGKLDDYQYAFPGYMRSEFPAWLRRLISEPALDDFYTGLVAFLRWVLLPGLLLPLGLLCAEFGLRGFFMLPTWWRALRNLAYWIVLIVAAIIGVYCAGKILHWTLDPRTASLGEEKTWLAFRMFGAYLLALLSWLWVCAMLARATRRPDPPAASQQVAA